LLEYLSAIEMKLLSGRPVDVSQFTNVVITTAMVVWATLQRTPPPNAETQNMDRENRSELRFASQNKQRARRIDTGIAAMKFNHLAMVLGLPKKYEGRGKRWLQGME
jgi:hypothetical protein